MIQAELEEGGKRQRVRAQGTGGAALAPMREQSWLVPLPDGGGRRWVWSWQPPGLLPDLGGW